MFFFDDVVHYTIMKKIYQTRMLLVVFWRRSVKLPQWRYSNKTVPCPCRGHTKWTLINSAQSRSLHDQSLTRRGTWSLQRFCLVDPAQVTGEVRRRQVVTTAEDKHGQSVVYSLRNRQSVQVTEQMCDGVVLRRVWKMSRCTSHTVTYVVAFWRRSAAGSSLASTCAASMKQPTSQPTRDSELIPLEFRRLLKTHLFCREPNHQHQ